MCIKTDRPSMNLIIKGGDANMKANTLRVFEAFS